MAASIVSPQLESPVIVGGSPSSGSTLLRVLCGRHPRFRTGGELHVFDHSPLFETRGAEFTRTARTCLARGVPRSYASLVDWLFNDHDDWGWRRDELLPLINASSSWSELLMTFFARSEIDGHRTRWLEKTPENVFGYAQARNGFRDASFIHTMRDGRDVVASLTARGHSIFRAATRWYCATLAGLALGDHPDVIHVSYEALVRDPSQQMAVVLGRLGEEYDPAVLETDPNARPLIGSWRSAEYGDVSDRSIGRLRDEDVDAVAAVFSAIRLSDDGYELLDRARLPNATATVWASASNATDLLALMGYECQRGRRLRPSERSAIRMELDAFQVGQRARYGIVRACCPTTI